MEGSSPVRRPLLLLAALCLLPGDETLGAGERPPEILSVLPARESGLLVCRVRTAGLPGERASRSLLGGLPSTVDFFLDLLDARERVIVERRITFRLAFDLWEEIFRVDGGGTERRFESIESVRSFLADGDRLQVAPLSSLRFDERYQVRVGLIHHAIAPAQKGRIGDWIAGEGAGIARDPDEREVSLGLGSLIRFFFGESQGQRSPPREATSRWFRLEDLPDATD